MSKIVNLSKVTTEQNQTGYRSSILNYEIPIGNVMLVPSQTKFKLLIPTRVEKEHAGGGEEEFDLSKTYDTGANDDEDSNASVVESAWLGDETTVYAVTKADGTVLTTASVDYDNNKATIDHDTNENILIYFLFGEGQVELDIIAPVANGGLNKTIFDMSAYDIHADNQIKGTSLIKTDGTSYPIPESYYLKLFYEGDVQVYWGDDNIDLIPIAQFTIPVRFADRNSPSFGRKNGLTFEERFNNLLTS